MAQAIVNPWEEAFGHVAARKLAAYLTTMNLATQAVTLDANANDLQTTGSGAAILNGTPFTVAEDQAYDISAEAAYAAWATAQSYTTITEVTVLDKNITKHFVCISAHTSSSSNHPVTGADGSTYWRELSHWAEDAAGDVIAANTTKYYLACVNSAGTLRLFNAYDANLACKIPAYDPTRYVAVALMLAGTTTAVTIGTTVLTGISTFWQIIGPCIPDYRCF